MRLTDFLNELPMLWAGDPQLADHPIDRRFGDVIREMGGMATENKLALLNLAGRYLCSDEVYLEIGAFRGTSIIAASLHNPGQRFVTVDNFSQFGGAYAECRENLSRYGCDNVELIDAHAWEVLSNPPFRDRVGVYFYDGRHRFRDQWGALARVEALLADEALVIIDDTSWRQVRAANRLYTKGHPDFEQVASFASPRNEEPRWWNGVEVFAFRRSGREVDQRGAGKRAIYLGGVAYYDVLRFYGGAAKDWVRRGTRQRGLIRHGHASDGCESVGRGGAARSTSGASGQRSGSGRAS